MRRDVNLSAHSLDTGMRPRRCAKYGAFSSKSWYDATYMARLYLRSPTEVAEMLGQRGRRLRVAQGLTQAEVARRAGVGRRTLQRFEDTGGVGVEAMIRIAFVLGVPDTFDTLFPLPPPRSIDDVLSRPDEDVR